MTWNPFPDTTLRAAVFRVLKRTLITEQTLEPTQVAGFNQFFDDEESTESWRYGVGVDQRFTPSLYGGVEFSLRDLDVPGQVVSPDSDEIRIVREDWREYLARVYVYWTPHRWLALTAEYLYEQFEQTDNGLRNEAFTELRTHRVPIGLRFFHPSGVGFLVTATYVNQDGDFQPRGSDCCVSDQEDFWVVDAALSYRLPKRWGLLTVGVSNLFDEQFRYQETDVRMRAFCPPARSSPG